MKKSIVAFAERIFLSLLLIAISGVELFSQQSSSAALQLDAARSTFALIERNNIYTENLSSASQNVLPVGIRRVVNNMEVTIAVDKVTFLPEYAEMSVLAKAVLPQGGDGGERVLFFGARGIKLSYEGSIIGNADLTLLQDIEIPFNGGNMSIVLKGDYDSRTGNSKSKTYLSIDCKGFKELGLDAEVRFPTSLMTNAEPNAADKVVSGHFQTVVQNWNDIIAEITLPSFEIVGLDGFVFNLRDVVLDFSDSRNSESVRYPHGYKTKYMIPDAVTLWRGVYANELDITLPPAFATSDGAPTRFSARGMIIDENGMTGKFTAANILPFEMGDASGWNFSVNTFDLELEAGSLIAAGFTGEIGLPICESTSRLGYQAMIRENNEYLMRVETVESLDFSVFNARASILPNSYLALDVVNGKFVPEACLHGSMAIADKYGDVPVDIPSLDFRSLTIKTTDPYISVEYLGYNGKVTLGQFPVSLNDISMKCVGDKITLSSGVDVSFDAFAGHTNISFLSSMKERRWRYDETRLDKITIDAKIAEILELGGTLVWHRADPIYGDGFFGDVRMGIKKPFSLQVETRACFGSKDGFKYWFADGGVTIPGGIPVAGPLTIKGFSGAVTQNMVGTGQRTKSNGSVFSSGTYIPDKSTSLGLKAAVLLEVQKVATGEACFEIAFTDKGGLSHVGFYGFAQFTGGKLNMDGLTDKYDAILAREKDYASASALKTLKQTDPNKAAGIVAPAPADYTFGVMGSLGIQYDFRNHSLHAQTELMINSKGGFMQGAGKDGKAGWGVLHFDPSEWYMHLGSPDNRLGVKLNVGNILNISSGTYLMTGSRIPDMPAPPAQVANILNEDLSKLTLGRSLESLSSGKGFALGSDFQLKTGDLTFLMMYANFDTGLGFDIMMKDYGYLECCGQSGPIGLNGWFAQGQAYAYLQGELGVKINLWALKKKVPVIKGGAAALMQATLPNPTSFKGYLGVNVNILGLIKGNMRFKLSLGDDCQPVMPGSSPVNMPLISDLAPSDAESNVSVFAMPQATFNIPVGQPFDAELDAGTETFKAELKAFTLKTESGESVSGELKWNSAADAVTFRAKEILPPNTALTAEVCIEFYKLSGSTWRLVTTSGEEASETRKCRFTTGGAPENIPHENIVYSYPVVDQQFYLPGEWRKGYVQLQFGQKYLFEKGFDYKLSFAGNNQEIVADFRYNEQDNRLEFDIPELATGQQYEILLSYASAEAATVGATTSTQLIDTDDGSLSMESKGAEAGVNLSARKEILAYGFTSSRYKTFAEKIKDIDLAGKSIAEDAAVSFRFLYKVQSKEIFDAAEVAGVEKSGGRALVQPYAELKEPFFTETIQKLVYDGYPFGGLRLSYREDTEIGVPPVRSVFVYPPYADMLEQGRRSVSFYFPFSFETGVVAEYDFRDLQSQVVNNRSKVSKAVYDRFATGSLPFLKYGKYKVILQYVLPDGRITSKQDFYYYNFLEFNK